MVFRRRSFRRPRLARRRFPSRRTFRRRVTGFRRRRVIKRRFVRRRRPGDSRRVVPKKSYRFAGASWAPTSLYDIRDIPHRSYAKWARAVAYADTLANAANGPFTIFNPGLQVAAFQVNDIVNMVPADGVGAYGEVTYATLYDYYRVVKAKLVVDFQMISVTTAVLPRFRLGLFASMSASSIPGLDLTTGLAFETGIALRTMVRPYKLLGEAAFMWVVSTEGMQPGKSRVRGSLKIDLPTLSTQISPAEWWASSAFEAATNASPATGEFINLVIWDPTEATDELLTARYSVSVRLEQFVLLERAADIS